MVLANDIGNLALVPVRGTVFVVKLPFVLVWGVLCWICTLVCILACYAKKKIHGLFGRIAVTWNWTKSSAKTLLPSSSSNTGTQLDCNLEKRFEDDLLDTELLAERRPSTRVGRRQRKKAIVSALIQALLEPTSPQESEDEAAERSDGEDRVYQLVRDLIQFSKSGLQSPTPKAVHCPVLDFKALRRSAQDKEKLLNFISELDQYVTDMDMDSQRGTKERTQGSVRAVEVGYSDRRQGGQEKYDLLVTPEPVSICSQDIYQGGAEQQVYQDDYDDEFVGEDDETQFDDAQMNFPYIDSVIPPYRGLSPVVEVSSELASSELASADSIESIKNCHDLETELNVAMSRLSSISNELEEAVLESRQTKVTETVTIGTCFEPARKLLSESADSPYEDACDEFPSIPNSPPTLGIQAGRDRRHVASARKSRPPSLSKRSQQIEGIVQLSYSEESSNESDSNQSSQYSSDEDNGDSDHRTDAMRSEVERLSHSLSDQIKLLAPASLQHRGSCHAALSECQQKKKHHHNIQSSSSTSVSDIYSTVNKALKRSSRAHSEGNEVTDIPHVPVHRVQSSSLSELENIEAVRGQEVDSKKPSEKSLFIHDCVPPWKQMRSRSSSVGFDTPEMTPTQTPLHSHTIFHTTTTSIGTEDTSRDTPPPIPLRTGSMSSPASQSRSPLQLQEKRSPASSGFPQQSQALHSMNNGPDSNSLQFYDKLLKALPTPPPIPSQAGLEGIYDTIPYQRRYLHEKVLVRDKRSESPATPSHPSHPPVSWTPELPARNSPTMRRTTSVDAVGEVVGDQDGYRLSRYGSEKRPSTSSQDLHRECSSSSRRHRSSSGESDRDRKRKEHTSSSSSDHHHHHHSRHHHHGEHSRTKHRSSSEKHHSSDKKSSKSQEKSSLLKILVPSSSKSKTTSRSSKELSKKKEEKKVKKEEKKDQKHSSSPKSKDKEESKEETKIPRNGSGSSLKSGTTMFSTGSTSSSSD